MDIPLEDFLSKLPKEDQEAIKKRAQELSQEFITLSKAEVDLCYAALSERLVDLEQIEGEEKDDPDLITEITEMKEVIAKLEAFLA